MFFIGTFRGYLPNGETRVRFFLASKNRQQIIRAEDVYYERVLISKYLEVTGYLSLGKK